jgi:hypothetical protein
MPQAVSRLGWVLGFIVILLFAGLEVFSGIALTVVFKAASITLNRRPHSFGDLGLAAYGHRGQQIVQYVQFAQLWAYCVVVQYIASKNLTYVIRAAGGGTCTVGTQAMVVLLVLPALQLQRLREAAFLAVFGVATISIVLILYFSQMATETGHSLTDVDIPHSTTATDSLVEIMVRDCCQRTATPQPHAPPLIRTHTHARTHIHAEHARLHTQACRFTKLHPSGCRPHVYFQRRVLVANEVDR